jgi:hypothetical protein
MTTLLDKTVKREVRIGDRSYIVAISPLTLKLTPKGKRRALNASVDKFTAATPVQPRKPSDETSGGEAGHIQLRPPSCPGRV